MSRNINELIEEKVVEIITLWNEAMESCIELCGGEEFIEAGGIMRTRVNKPLYVEFVATQPNERVYIVLEGIFDKSDEEFNFKVEVSSPVLEEMKGVINEYNLKN